MKYLALQLILISILITTVAAQGPPIRLDKPIMLGAGESTVRALYNYVDSDFLNFSSLNLEVDYNITNSMAIGMEIPWLFTHDLGGSRVGDLGVMMKYQFFQNDGMGKSTRIAAKIKQMFPTGEDLKIPGLGMGHYKTYSGLTGAYESLNMGIQAELGYAIIPSNSHLNYLSYKLGVGIPLLKPSYPVNQINVYIESEAIHLKSQNGNARYAYYLAPGLQYARGKFTLETSLQFTIREELPITYLRNWSLLLGGRMVI
nr:hypothetical protein [Saprospiraceae bacterium]